MITKIKKRIYNLYDGLIRQEREASKAGNVERANRLNDERITVRMVMRIIDEEITEAMLDILNQERDLEDGPGTIAEQIGEELRRAGDA